MLRRSDAPILRRSDEKNVGKHNQDRSPKTAKPTSELILKERTKKNKEKQRKKQKPRKEKKREKKTQIRIKHLVISTNGRNYYKWLKVKLIDIF